MVRIVTGDLGAGKTLYSVGEIYDDLCNGLTVASNIRVRFPEIQRLAKMDRGVVLRPEQFWPVELGKDRRWHVAIPWGSAAGHVRVYLDEIHLFFNSRDWQKTGELYRDLLSFLSQSRKARVDVTFITQEITNMERQFRVLAEWEERIVPSSHIPMASLGKMPDVFKFFVVAKRDTRDGNLIGRTYKKYDSRFFDCYNTAEFLDPTMEELGKDRPRVEPFKLSRVHWSKRLLWKVPGLRPKLEIAES